MNFFFQAILLPLGVTLLGALIVWLISRRKRDYKITCEQLSSRQYKEKESNDVKISLSYKNERVGDSLSVLTVRLANNGNKDVAFNQMFEGKIQIILKKARILDVQIEKQSDKVGAVIDHSEGGDWLLSWAILKRKEIIVLKVVSVLNPEESVENVTVGDLEFVFRGNNINEIEPINSFQERVFIRFIIFISVLLLAGIALMPFHSSVKYDGVAQGQSFRGADISYNAYTKRYSVDQAHKPIIKTDDFQSISVSKQPIIASDIRLNGIIFIVYIVGLILFSVLALRRPRLFRKLFYLRSSSTN